MAHLHVKTPNGTAYSIDLDTVTSQGSTPSTGENGENGWCKLPNGLIIQFGRSRNSRKFMFPVEFNSTNYTPLSCHLGYSPTATALNDSSDTHTTTYQWVELAHGVGDFIWLIAIGY